MKEFITDSEQEVQAASAQKVQTPEMAFREGFKDKVRDGSRGVCVQFMNIVGN